MSSPAKKILLAIAGAEASIITAQYAICLARALDSELFTIYVVDMKSLDDLLRAKVFVETEELEYERELTQQGENYLNHIQELATAKGVKISSFLAKGVIHEEVSKKAKELDADLLVMGDLKELTSRRDAFYDEGERIFREVKCPVLVVKGGEEIEQMYEGL